MSVTRRLMSGVLLVALIAGCGSGSSSTQATAQRPDFEGVPWMHQSGASITFENGTATGSTGCNRFTAPYSGTGTELTFGPAATTQMACTGKAQDTERAFLRVLTQVRQVAVTGGGELSLSDASGNELIRFTKASPAGHWTVTAFLHNDAVSSPLAGTKITADFGDGGSLTGFGGCNDYHGKYTIDQGKLEISGLGATAKHCEQPNGVSEQELAYLDALPRTAGYEVEGDKLTLLTAKHTIVANYQRSG